MKLKMVLMIALLSTSKAFAADSLLITCNPTDKTNGLGIFSIALDVSNEDPEADMVVRYNNDPMKPFKSNMAYEGSDSSFTLTPQGEGDGELSVHLESAGVSKWTASVSHSSADTFSILECQEK